MTAKIKNYWLPVEDLPQEQTYCSWIKAQVLQVEATVQLHQKYNSQIDVRQPQGD